MKHILIVFAALWALSAPASAAELDLERWLDEPDIKLVAVEFYADWCEPCKASAPRWEALRKKYASQGLKLVVVNISEHPAEQGRCTRLPWNPDESLCDPKLGERLGVKSLPEAFVWSWQGNLLVERGQHVDQIERIIRRYLDDNPRVTVSGLGQGGKPDKALQRLVEANLARAGKLTVVPDQEMQARLAAVRKASHGAGKRDDQRCAIGAEVSANSLLTAERFEGALSLSLADAVSGCQRATASVPWGDEPAEKIVQKATYRLMAQLKRRQVQMPKGAERKTRRARREAVGVEEVEEESEWVAEEEVASVTFSSDPSGAKVSLDDAIICDTTPCTREVSPGRHRVSMSLDRYKPLARSVTLEDGQMVGWRLKPTFGTLTVNSSPEGLDIELNGEVIGQTPKADIEVPAGKHKVSVGGPCHAPKAQKISMPAGKTHTLNLKPKARRAGLRVEAINSEGDPVKGAEVFVDDKRLGVAPKTFTLDLCNQRVEVRHKEYATWQADLSLKEKKTIKLSAELGLSTRAAAKAAEAKAEAAKAQAAAEARAEAEAKARAEAEAKARAEAEAIAAAEAEAEAEAAEAEEVDAGSETADLLDAFHLRYEAVTGGAFHNGHFGLLLQTGLAMNFNRYIGLGFSVDAILRTSDFGSPLIHAHSTLRGYLPLGDDFELTGAIGVGIAFDAYDSDLGLSIPLSVGAAYKVSDNILIGVQAGVTYDMSLTSQTTGYGGLDDFVMGGDESSDETARRWRSEGGDESSDETARRRPPEDRWNDSSASCADTGGYDTQEDCVTDLLDDSGCFTCWEVPVEDGLYCWGQVNLCDTGEFGLSTNASADGSELLTATFGLYLQIAF